MKKGQTHSDSSKLKMSKSQKTAINTGRFQFGHEGYKSRQKYKPFSLENFNDGYIFDGRFVVIVPNHPRANKHGYIFRSIAAYEIYHNVRVNATHEIHHIDSNRMNDTRENLSCLTKAEHRTLHHKGRIKSPEERKKLSIALTGKTLPQSVRDKIKAAVSGENNVHRGRKRTEETKSKMKAAWVIRKEKHV